MSQPSINQDAEDILSESLEFLGGKPVIDDSVIRYGTLELTVAPKDDICDLGRQMKPKANSLLADHLFSPALFLAERIERGLLDARGKTVIELGSGSALPSFLLSSLSDPPSLVVVTDYPDASILNNLRMNVQRNSAAVEKGCTVKCEGYEWGKDPSKLLELTSTGDGYDVMILSDLLHFFDSHDALISSIGMLLAKTKDARVYVGAGNYTHAHVCDSFLQKALTRGLHMQEIRDEGEDTKWMGTLSVSTLDHEVLELRKNNCRYWVGRWSESVTSRN